MKRTSLVVLVSSLFFFVHVPQASAQQPKAVIDALSKVCGDLWTLHDMGMGIVQKKEKIGADEDAQKGRKQMDNANKEALIYQCPRRSKQLTEKTQKNTIQLTLDASDDTMNYVIGETIKKLKGHEQDYRDTLANE